MVKAAAEAAGWGVAALGEVVRVAEAGVAAPMAARAAAEAVKAVRHQEPQAA